MIKPGQQKFCQISQEWDFLKFHNLRDFRWTSEWIDQKQNRIEKIFELNKIKSLDLYISPFAFHNWIWHTILGFNFSDDKKIYLSVEWQLDIGEKYSFWKAIWPWYRIRYIRWTEKDIIWLRAEFWKEKIYKYPLHISIDMIKSLFLWFVWKTNESKNHTEHYGLIANNCTSSLWITAKQHLNMKKWHWGLVFNKFLPKFLNKLDILNLNEKERIMKV